METTTTKTEEERASADLTPRMIVQALDRHIVGQSEAKKMVAIALRNRTRRQKLDEALREEVIPKNIIMIGPTGVGKTEIARRLAKLVNAPFVKVEATKYTEVGYVGRDVESMVRDLVETAVKMVRDQRIEEVRDQAEKRVRDRILDLVAGEKSLGRRIVAGFGEPTGARVEEGGPPSRDDLKRKYDRGELDDREVEIEVSIKPAIDGIYGAIGIDEQSLSGMRDMLEKIMPQKNRRKKMSVAEARRVMLEEESESMLDMEKVTRDAVELAEQSGIIFIDEIDKIAGRGSGQHGPDVSRQGVQRDILPIVEGSTVQTKRGSVRTDHILFIAAGAFHMSKPSDLIPELQGRFPLRVELEPLTAADFERILTEPDSSLIEQYKALLGTDGVILNFTEDGIKEIAVSAFQVNEKTENIGARRLHTVMERVLQDVLFDAPDVARGEFTIDREYVRTRLEPLMKHEDLSRFIL